MKTKQIEKFYFNSVQVSYTHMAVAITKNQCSTNDQNK